MVKQITAKEIHDEFCLASDNLLEEVKQVLQDDFEADRLKELGFKSIKKVSDREDVLTKRRYAETVAYYRQKYPFRKFLLQLSVEAICKKYGLLCGDVHNFTGEIPQKNVEEILSFKVRDEDRPESDDTTWFSSGRMGEKFDKFFLCEGKWCEEKVESTHREKITLKICAPEAMFNKKNLNVVDGYMLVSDPIVLQPVKGGYLIVTAWGDEATDEIVVNEGMN